MPTKAAPFRACTYSWRLALCLALAAFLLRSLVPVGFMPNTASGANGNIALTICFSGAGHSAGLADAPEPGQDSASPDNCPFGLLTSPLANLPPPVMAAPSLHKAAAAGARIDPPSRRSVAGGPPLGSRAPPAYASSIA